MNRFKRILKISLISLGSLLLLLILGTFIVLRYYEDDVVNYAIREAKTKFKTRVEFGPADLAFWETFPNASIRFTDVYIEETFATKDTLIFAKEAYLEFNLFDLFRGSYDLEALDVRDSETDLKVNAEGEDNWHFWISDATDTSDYNIEMEEVVLRNALFSYDDRQAQFSIAGTTAETKLEGQFSGKQFALESDLQARIHQLIDKSNVYALNQDLKAKFHLDADVDHDTYKITNGEMVWGKLPLRLAGEINVSEKSSIDLQAAGAQLDMEDLHSSLPLVARRALEDYDPDGKLSISLTVKGDTYGNKTPDIDAQCVITDGEIEHQRSGMELDNMQCDLRYLRKGGADMLTIRSLKASLDKGYIDVSGTVKNFAEPLVDLQAGLSANMEDLRDFFAWDTLEVCRGDLALQAHIQGKISFDKKDSTLHWDKLQTTGKAEVANGSMKLKNSNREFRELSSSVEFSDRDAKIQNLSGVVNGSDFQIHGMIKNLIPFFTDEESRLVMNADLKSSVIDFTNLVETSESTSSNEQYEFILPHRIDFTMNSKVDKFIFRKFEATNVKGVAEYKNKRFVVDPVSFNTAEGTFTAQLAFDETSDKLYRMNVLAKLKDINIQKLFTEFENFDQEFIQDRHLSGKANATVQFRTILTTSLDVMEDKIESLIDLTIDNGELNGLASLQDISDYIRQNKWAAPFVDEDRFADKMKNIRFSRMENVIEIKDRQIIIPQMDIKSTAMDLKAKGVHGFDNSIEYTIGFSLRELLVRKQTEWEVEDDGLGKKLFVTMTGTTDNPNFKIDKNAAKENRKEELAAEKENVKALLKEEFGLFKRDNSVKEYKEAVAPVGSATTTIEWEGYDSKTEEKKTQASNLPKAEQPKKTEPVEEPKGKPKKVPKWLEEKK